MAYRFSNQIIKSCIPLNGDWEFGEIDDIETNSGLAMALPVEEVEAYTPTATEFDLKSQIFSIALGAYINS